MRLGARQERRAPVRGVALSELQVPALARHAANDVADAAPRVEPAVDELKLRLGRRHERQADGGAEEGTASVQLVSRRQAAPVA
jgi:hypothetical protein